MAAVRFDSVTKVYPGGVTAVSDLTLDIPDGRFVVLVGPSGCGKSTILRLVAGLERLTAGTISIGDRVVNDVPPRDRNIAMVFQNYALYPHMTVEKNLSFGLRMRKVAKAEIAGRVTKAAEQLGIGDLLQRKPKALSGGQQQRVALGRALVRQPQCFLFDEPLSNLDARLRVQMRAELKALHQRLQTTTIHVTHDQEEAMMLAEQVVVLCAGEVQQVGGPLEIYRRPANRFVAEFVGSPTMNLIEGTLRPGPGGTIFDDGRGVAVPVGNVGGGGEPRPAVLGIRPESLSPADAHASARLPCTVTLCEPLGDRIDVHARTAGGTTIVARMAATEVHAPGDALQLSFDRAGVHCFEPGPHGARIELADPAG